MITLVVFVSFFQRRQINNASSVRAEILTHNFGDLWTPTDTSSTKIAQNSKFTISFIFLMKLWSFFMFLGPLNHLLEISFFSVFHKITHFWCSFIHLLRIYIYCLQFAIKGVEKFVLSCKIIYFNMILFVSHSRELDIFFGFVFILGNSYMLRSMLELMIIVTNHIIEFQDVWNEYLNMIAKIL